MGDRILQWIKGIHELMVNELMKVTQHRPCSLLLFLIKKDFIYINDKIFNILFLKCC